MLITNEQITTAIQLFRWVNPSIDYEVHSWFKGDPIELNKIYKYKDMNGRCIAIWTEFIGLNDVKITRVLKKINTVPHVFFLEHFDSTIRIGWKVKKEMRKSDPNDRIIRN